MADVEMEQPKIEPKEEIVEATNGDAAKVAPAEETAKTDSVGIRSTYRCRRSFQFILARFRLGGGRCVGCNYNTSKVCPHRGIRKGIMESKLI